MGTEGGGGEAWGAAIPPGQAQLQEPRAQPNECVATFLT